MAGIFLLLILQAYCDLALPTYTSDILNVGLQQGGIEDAVPETLRRESMEDLKLFLTEEECTVFDYCYETEDGENILHLKKGADRKMLEEILVLPEGMVYQLANSEDASFSLDQVRTAVKMKLLTPEKLQEQAASKMEGLTEGADTYLKQVAVAYVKAEYEAQGRNMQSIQNRYLFEVGARMMLMALLMSVSAILTGLLAARTSAKIGHDLREQLYSKVMRFTSAEMEKFSTASLITRCTNDIQQVTMVIVMLLRMVLYSPILACFGIFHVIRTGAGMGWIIVLAVIIISALIGILVGIAMPKFKIMQKLVDRVNLVSREILTGIMPIRAFSREKYEEDRFEKANRDLYGTQLFTNRAMTFMMPVMMFVMNGVSVLIVWVGAKKVDLGTIQVGDLTAFITYSMVIIMGFMMLTMISVMLPRAGVAAGRIVEVIDTPVTLTDPQDTRDEELKKSGSNVCFENVSFTYPGADTPALSDISFTAEAGKTTAIIGSTGCGKSTLVNLIPRFYDVTEGRITLGGTDIRQVSQKALRDRIGLVPQKGMLFSGTVETNLKYGGDQITDEAMKEAARIAQVEEFILSKEDGYQAHIAQEGSNVSGGQRQRLAIARAIAKDPGVYVFDDSFSALDYKTDLALRKELAAKTKNAVVIIVAQRISTILHADQILCMEDGKIVGKGTHEELLRTCPTYQEIARSQLSEKELAEARKIAGSMAGGKEAE